MARNGSTRSWAILARARSLKGARQHRAWRAVAAKTRDEPARPGTTHRDTYRPACAAHRDGGRDARRAGTLPLQRRRSQNSGASQADQPRRGRWGGGLTATGRLTDSAWLAFYGYCIG